MAAKKSGEVNTSQGKGGTKSTASKSSSKKSGTKQSAQKQPSPEGAVRFEKGFVKESFEELKKVSTPTRAEANQATLVTVLIIVFVALCLFLLDIVFDQLMRALLT